MFVATHAVEVNGPTYNKSFSESHSSTVAIPPPLEVTTSPTIKSVPFCALKVIVYASDVLVTSVVILSDTKLSTNSSIKSSYTQAPVPN